MITTRYILAYFGTIICCLQMAGQTNAGSATTIEANDTIISGYTDLDEIIIEAKKELIKSDGATLTYDLEQDDTSKGTSVLEALKKVPMISVDGQDNIRIKGDSNFRIYVNGKEEPMLTANAKQILKAMPAESVSKIEVITEPGAKYDAEGTAGIINLITERKQRKDGYAGSLSANIGAADEGLSAYGRLKHNRVTADANVNYSDNELMKRSNVTRQETINLSGDDLYQTLQNFKQKYGFRYIGGGLNMSWEPGDKDLITLTGNVFSVNADLTQLSVNTRSFSKEGQLMQAYSQNANGKMENLGLNGSASYKRLFSGNSHYITAAYGFNYGKDLLALNYSNERELNAEMIPAYERNKTTGYTREHTVTTDYSQPIYGDTHLIETGIKGVFRRNTANSGQYYGNLPGELTENPDNISLTKQLQDIYAVYLSYSGSFNKIALKAGLRYEHTYMGMDFERGTGENYKRHLNDVAPNGAVTWLIGPATNLRLAYQMRITRPNLTQMNPYRLQIIQNEIRMGNPNLESERYHNLTLTYSNYGRIFGGNLALEGSRSDNTIEEYIYSDANILYHTYANIGHRQKIGLNGFLNVNITSNMSAGINGNIFYTSIKSGDGSLSNHGWNGSYGANFNYTGPWKMKYSLYGGQSTGDISLQGKWYGWYYYGIGLSKSFLQNDALTVALNASNFLTKYNYFKNKIETKDQYQRSSYGNPSWNVGISISWNFGHLSEQVKKTGANLENDDMKKGGKTGGGIGL